jgi:TonB family protein
VTLREFQLANQRNQPQQRPQPPPPPVRAPTITTTDISQRLNSSLGSAASREQAQRLSAQEQRELDEYYRLLRALLENAWARPEGISAQLRATVNFTVTASGGITGARITDRSGVAVFDASVMDVFQRVTSFRPPPQRQTWNFEITFGLQ